MSEFLLILFNTVQPLIMILVVVAIVMSPIIIYMSRENRWQRFWEKIEKRLWLTIFAIIISPIIITFILFLVRGDNFVGYYVDGKELVYYQDSYYSRIADEAKKLEAYQYGEGYWSYEEAYISNTPIEFPYFEYWMPDLFFGHLLYPGTKDAKYIIVSTTGGDIYYERVEE